MRRSAALALTACVALLGSGCSGSPAADPAASPSLTLAPSPTPTDLGPTASFLDQPQQAPIAITPAKDDSSFSGATFSILRVQSDARGTLVVWSATHPRTLSAGVDFDVRKWSSFPVLRTKTQAFSVLTYENSTGQTECVCVDMRAMRPDPNPQGAMYPPLPKGTTSVILTSPWFRDVTVPVSRS